MTLITLIALTGTAAEKAVSNWDVATALGTIGATLVALGIALSDNLRHVVDGRRRARLMAHRLAFPLLQMVNRSQSLSVACSAARLAMGEEHSDYERAMRQIGSICKQLQGLLQLIRIGDVATLDVRLAGPVVLAIGKLDIVLMVVESHVNAFLLPEGSHQGALDHITAEAVLGWCSINARTASTNLKEEIGKVILAYGVELDSEILAEEAAPLPVRSSGF